MDSSSRSRHSRRRYVGPYQISLVVTFLIGVVVLSLCPRHIRWWILPTAGTSTCTVAAAVSSLVPSSAGLRWILVQHFPTLMASLFAQSNDAVWADWENTLVETSIIASSSSSNRDHHTMDNIPTIDWRDMMLRLAATDNNNNNSNNNVEIRVVQYVAQQMGDDWQRRPLLIKGLWSEPELQQQQQQQQVEANQRAEETTNHHYHYHHRRLSLAGLLKEEMVVPYYYDATTGAVTPDAMGRIRDIVANMTKSTIATTEGGESSSSPSPSSHHHHKIATQLLLQKYPVLLNEVIPPHQRGILTALLGDYLQPRSIVGSGPFQLFPALTTVPLFVAGGAAAAATTTAGDGDGGGSDGHCDHNDDANDENEAYDSADRTNNNNTNSTNNTDSHKVGTTTATTTGTATTATTTTTTVPYTPLHSEPICNLAVQLAGRKHWTLVDARHWRQLRPRLAVDGRAFVESITTTTHDDDATAADPAKHVPPQQQQYDYYQGTTESGDALWLPAWTWHRVDYHDSLLHSTTLTTTTLSSSSSSSSPPSTISIGASVFHFRFDLFVRQNPVLALAVIPALIRELLGRAMQ